MKLVSPDGNVSIDAHPSKVESLKNMGWKEEAAPKEIKSSSKKSKAKIEEVLDENIEE
jgi:Holliday junction resolvasome RuvABC DNA-binding subunit